MAKDMQRNIDWQALATRLGAFSEPNAELGSSAMARAALEEIVGPQALRDAVDHYVARAPGAELARSVLWQLHPWSAMQRCHEIFLTSPDLEARRTAIELLRVVADGRALPWIAQYLADPDPRIQFWGAGILDQLLFSSLVELDDCTSLLDAMAVHENEKIREQHAALMEIVSGTDPA